MMDLTMKQRLFADHYIENTIKNIGKIKISDEAINLGIDFLSLKFEECEFKSENGQTYSKYDLKFDT